jgi:hypothetical protein
VSTSDNLNAKKGGNMASLTPAYGRDYKNQKAALADWYAGKDFILHEMLSEGLVNIDDCPPGNHQLRYDRMQKVIMVNPAKKPKVPTAADRDKSALAKLLNGGGLLSVGAVVDWKDGK